MVDRDAQLAKAIEVLRREGDPREVLAALQEISVRGPNTQAGMLATSAWLRIVRREGPSVEAEAFFRNQLEEGLAIPVPADSDLATLTVFRPLIALEEYLVMQGRFDEAAAENERTVPSFGLHEATKLIEPRGEVLDLAAAFSGVLGGGVFEPNEQARLIADALAHSPSGLTTSEVWVGRREAPLPDGRVLEIVLFGFPTAIRTDEPFFVAHAQTKGATRAHVFHLAWRRREAVAYPIALDTGPRGSRQPGASFGGGAPCGLAGFASPFVEPFIAFIQAQLAPLSPDEPSYFGGMPLPGVSVAELLRREETDKAAEGRRWKRTLLAIAALVALVGSALVIYVGHSAYRLFFNPAQATLAPFYTAMNRLGDKPVSPPSTPFACSAHEPARGAVSVLLDDPGNTLGLSTKIRSMNAGGATPSPYAVRGIVRSHDKTSGTRSKHTVVLDVELHRVNIDGAPGPESSVVCAGRVTAKLETYSPDFTRAQATELAERIGCRAVSSPRCEGRSLHDIVLTP